MQLARPSQSNTAISIVWALAPLFTCGIGTPFTIGYAAYRKRAPMIAVAALLYFLSIFVVFVLIVAYDSAESYPDAAGFVIVAGLFTNWIGGLIHSLAIRTTVFAPRAAGHGSYPPPQAPQAYRPSYPPANYPPQPGPGPYGNQNQHHNQQRPGAAPQRHPQAGPQHQWPQPRPQTQPQPHSQPQPQPRHPQSQPQPQDRRPPAYGHQNPEQAYTGPDQQPTRQRPGGSQPSYPHPQDQRPPQGTGPAAPPQSHGQGQGQGQGAGFGQAHDERRTADPISTNPPAPVNATAPGAGQSGMPSGSNSASTLPTQAPGPLPAGEPSHIGRYRLIGSLGQGGQGAVYLGETPDGTRVAIKVLHARLASETGAQQRFLREVEAARRVAPFSTARVIDADIADDRLFIVSEYVEGASLEQLVRERGPRGHDGLVRLALGTAGALAAIHRAGIVHRDFKPSNVLIGADGPRVVDFGIARVLDNATATSSGVLGTPAYMSPEQVSGERVGPESDVFSWAATMVFAATGRPAFGEDNIAAVFNRIFTKQPDLSALPDSLAQVVGKCLEKRPENRPSASDVMLAIVH
ncbi:serine/threonine-protein kinase [Sphaerisporangium perillae]|uniref:serine/threonine-protein kinase n=1 Tax=Sphaerisporangium perillae TaxID=2935860 RepID=UPI00201074B1|nr:serine/threonine-protein kinase [Sphaerisporangium perillae]